MAMDLPDACWELIFSFLDPHFDEHLPITYMCKRFFKISNESRTFLPFPFSRPVPSTVPPLLYARFPNLTHIILNHSDPQIEGFIRQLAASSIRLQNFCFCLQPYFPSDAMRILAKNMKETLRVLSCSGIERITEADVFVIADCFSYLHDLALVNISTRKAKDFITDKAVEAISTKIVSLSSLTITPCKDCFSRVSFESLALHCNSLSKLVIYFDEKNPVELHCFSSFKSLKALKLTYVNISDGGLIHLAQVGNLKSLAQLNFCSPIMSEVDGLAMCQFLKSCESLTTLKFDKFQFSRSTAEIDLAASIAKSIEVISIYHCVNLPKTMFYNLLKTCPRLKDVTLYNSETVIDDNSFDLPISYCMQSLSLSSITFSDKTLMRICCTCPKLRSFRISGNSRMTTHGAKAIFRGHHGNFNSLQISKQSGDLKEFRLYKDNSPHPDQLWCNVIDDEQDPYGEESINDFKIAYELWSEDESSQDSDKDDQDGCDGEASDEDYTEQDNYNDDEDGCEKAVSDQCEEEDHDEDGNVNDDTEGYI